MNYPQLRLQLYQQSLRQWLENLQQIGVGLVVLFPMALPVLASAAILTDNSAHHQAPPNPHTCASAPAD